MATVSIDIADKTTLDEIAAGLGNSSDAASGSPATLFAGLKYLLANGISLVRRIQRGTATMNGTGGATVNFSTALTNPDKCLVFLNGGAIPKDTYDGRLPYLDSLTASSMHIEGGYGHMSYVFSWQVIEFY